MIDAETTVADLNDLAGRVQPSDPRAASRLRDLAEAVSGGADADSWAVSNLFQIINPDKIVADHVNHLASEEWARWMELGRNVLVLLPLAITWIGIAWAVDAYRMQLQEDPTQSTQSFIYLWQTGFGGRTVLPLGLLAGIDGIILIAVFLLTLVVYARSAWLGHRNQNTGIKLGDDLGQALSQADLLLAQRRLPQSYTAMTKLERIAQDLLHAIDKEHGRLIELSDRREKELGDLSIFTTQLGEGANKMVQAAQSLQDNTQTAVGTMARVSESMLASQQTTTASMDDLSSALHKMHETQSGLLKELSAQQEQLLPSVRTTAAQLEQLGRRYGESVEQVLMLASQMRVVGENISVTSSDLKEALKRTSDAAREIGGIGNELGTKQAELIDKLDKGIETQERVAKSVTKSTADLDAVAESIKQIANNLRGIAKNMDDASQSTQSMEDAMTNLSKQQEEAANRLATSADRLRTMADSLAATLAGIDPNLNQVRGMGAENSRRR